MQHVQHVDRNISKADYNSGGVDELLVYSAFATIQGEGPWAGQRAFFIRLAGCDKGDKRSCPWCDTAFQFDKGVWMTFEEIATKFRAVAADYKLIVITGGEPSLQDNVGRFCDWWFRLHTNEHHYSEDEFTIQIESNGIRPFWMPNDSNGATSFQLIVSPKVNPVSQDYQTLRDAVLEQAYAFKFVISADPASPYHDIPGWAVRDLDPNQIYLSPICVYKRDVGPGEVASMWDPTLVDAGQTRVNYFRVGKLCKEHGYNVSFQKHLFLDLE